MAVYLDDADWHGGDTPDDLSGLIVVRDLRDRGLVLPWKLQGLVHPYLLDGFLPIVQAISRNGTCTSPLIATGSQHQG